MVARFAADRRSAACKSAAEIADKRIFFVADILKLFARAVNQGNRAVGFANEEVRQIRLLETSADVVSEISAVLQNVEILQVVDFGDNIRIRSTPPLCFAVIRILVARSFGSADVDIIDGI